MNPLTLDLRPVLRLTHREFEKIAVANRDLRLELTADGELIVMPPTGGNTGRLDTPRPLMDGDSQIYDRP